MTEGKGRLPTGSPVCTGVEGSCRQSVIGAGMSSLEDKLGSLIRDSIRSELRSIHEQLENLHGARGGGVSELPTFLTADEVAELAKVRPQTVRSWVSSNALPGHYAGRKLRIRLDELEAFMQREREQPERSLSDDDDLVREIVAAIRD